MLNHLKKSLLFCTSFGTFPITFFPISLFCFLTKARTWRHMIRPPLIGIRFTGLDQHRTSWSQIIAHSCTQGEWVAGNLSALSCWPTISFPLAESCTPTVTHNPPGPDKLQACMYDSFHVQAKVWSEDPCMDTFHGLLAPWQWRSRTAEMSAVWRKRTHQLIEAVWK